MKHISKIALLLLFCGLLAGCQAEEKPAYMSSNYWQTMPSTQAPEETLTPVYTRPAEETTVPEETYVPEETEAVIYQEGGYSGASGSNSSGSVESGSAVTGGTLVSTPATAGTNLSWAAIRSFPIKNSGMSNAERRNLCVDFFRFTKTALWTPNQTIKFGGDTMTAGTLYGSLPYVSMGTGNVYRLMDYLDEETGQVDLSDVFDGKTTLDPEEMIYFGNQCSYGSYVGWSRVVNSASGLLTAYMTKSKGYIPIGEYTYDTNKITTWTNATGYRTTDVLKANGDQTMYRSYAQLKIGDGLVYYTTAGHVIMCSSEPHVEYVPGSDKIDGNKSFITIIDQSGRWENITAGGKTFKSKKSVDAKITFAQLFKGNYVPFSFGELLGTDPMETTTYSFNHTGQEIADRQLFSAAITSNYGITDAYVIVTYSNGTVYKHAVRNKTGFNKTLRLARSGDNVDAWGTLKSGTHTVRIEAQLSTGERPVVYTGTLTVS